MAPAFLGLATPTWGTLTFACEWPVAGIAFTKVEVDAQRVIDAAARAQQIFERTEDAGYSYSSSTVTFSSTGSPEPPPKADG